MRAAFKPFITETLGADPVLIACGLPASYKTETTEVIARLKGYAILRTDLLRLEVLKGEDIFDTKVAADMDKRRRVYDIMFARASDLVAKGQGVILDATFITQALRLRAAEVAAAYGKTLVIQETRCPVEVSLGRIARRTREEYESNALTEEAYRNNQRRFEPVDLDDLKAHFPRLALIHLVVDTTSDAEDAWRVIAVDLRPG